MAATSDKAGVSHADFIEPVKDRNVGMSDENADSGSDDIVAALQHTGEEVGMTWRSFMAAMTMASSYNACLFTLLIPPAILSFINAELGPGLPTPGSRYRGTSASFLTGAAVLIIGSIVGATGQSIGQMIASGAIFGSGAGPLEIAFGAEIVPNDWRMVTIGLFDASSIIAQMMPLTSWAIIKYTGEWRNAYYFMIAFQAFNCGFLWLFYHPRTSAATLAPILIRQLLLAYGNIKEPLLPPRLFKQVRHFTMPIVVGMQCYSNATLWRRMSQLLYVTDEIPKGLYAEMVPLGTIHQVGGIAVLGSKKLGHQRWQIVFIALQTICVGLLWTAMIDNPVKSIILTVIVSMATAPVMLNCFVLVGFGIVDQNDIGTAAGLPGTAHRVSRAVDGLGFDASNLAALVAAARPGTAKACTAVPGINAEIQAAATKGNQLAYLDGARLSYKVAMAFGIVGCIAAFWIPSIDRRKYTKKTVALQESDRQNLEEKKLQGLGGLGGLGA
ncbi:hypothetical protein B0T10DRAFT_531385 [Thelonectria olida]|uniref:Major facilitator superfamily (MFS) profile domain-containing protein n=1 Tax=Thelonectria olida TaxID=1576542 RepID=A0A9P9AL60_9HYPO|nr:hypothetical protein B0T10DRAFT_531385 [Thelonectria olida]